MDWKGATLAALICTLPGLLIALSESRDVTVDKVDRFLVWTFVAIWIIGFVGIIPGVIK